MIRLKQYPEGSPTFVDPARVEFVIAARTGTPGAIGKVVGSILGMRNGHQLLVSESVEDVAKTIEKASPLLAFASGFPQ